MYRGQDGEVGRMDAAYGDRNCDAGALYAIRLCNGSPLADRTGSVVSSAYCVQRTMRA